jgi:membrane protease YdiL (CAAX protease family)
MMSLALIFVFLVFNAIGTMLTPAIGVVYSGQILMLLVLSAFLFFYCHKNNLWKTIGLTKVSWRDIKASLYYIPLVIMILANGVLFFDRTIPVLDVFMAVAFMTLIAFTEEVLFRGLLLKAIEERRNTKAAVLISGITFGLGHIVNLLNGYSDIKQVLQIILAVSIGLVLGVLFVRTKSIVPGIAFHFFFNIASALSRDAEPVQNYAAIGVSIAVSLAYMVYLFGNKLKRLSSSFE